MADPLLNFSRRIIALLSPIIEYEENKAKTLTCQSTRLYLTIDPRIYFIKRLLELVFARQKSMPKYFRLKSPDKWRMRMAASALLSQMPTPCKINCVFCFQEGNPRHLRQTYDMSLEEIKTRLKYYKKGYGLIGAEPYDTDEFLNHPHLEMILREMRKKTNETFDFITSGEPLTVKMIKMLAKYRPVFIIISLNSANPEIRKKIMRDNNPEIAINSIPILKSYQIPFIVSIVAWPGIGMTDIENTIAYADRHNALMVRILLPSYTKYFKLIKHFKTARYWERIFKGSERIKKKYRTPIMVIPYIYPKRMIGGNEIDAPVVRGVIKNSPAYYSGVKVNDVVTGINGKVVDSIEKAINYLIENGKATMVLKIKRKKNEITVKLNKRNSKYPYENECHKNYPLGLVFGAGLPGKMFLPDEDIRNIKNYAVIHNASKLLILTSRLYYAVLRNALRKNRDLFEGLEVNLRCIKNYFMGGNIYGIDMATVSDFIRNIKEITRKKKPDLIILPGSPFNNWGRDFTGRINLDIERKVNIPVEFIY